MPATPAMIESARQTERELITRYATASGSDALRLEDARHTLCALRLIAQSPEDSLLPELTGGVTLTREEITDVDFNSLIHEARGLMGFRG